MPLTSPAAPALQRRALRAHTDLGAGPRALAGLRPLVADSWTRSLAHLGGPDRIPPRPGLPEGELDRLRRGHPLALVRPVFERLLVEPARDTGLLVAVGDAQGRLLWVDGDAAARRRAEAMAFEPGADWSEAAVGTSAPGTALAVGAGVQVAGAEHFSRDAHQWSCTAVPVACPDTGRLLGVVDLTGGEEAVAAHSLALLQAAVAAAQAEMRLARLAARGDDGGARRPPGPHPAGSPAAGKPGGRGPGIGSPAVGNPAARRAQPGSPAARRARPGNRAVRTAPGVVLAVTGPAAGAGAPGGTGHPLGLRHAEILTLLALHPEGLTAEGLADLLHAEPDAADVGTLRAEMVRLRRAAGAIDPLLVPASRPYRLPAGVRTDAQAVLDALEDGDHEAALGRYRGRVLPRSEAPGIAALRERVSATLRESMVADADADCLLAYLALPEAAEDADGLRTALRLLPARSPRRAAVVARLEALGA